MSRIEDGGAVEAGLVERIKELERHCVRLGQGGAERYWEGRYRDEAADNTALRAEITRLRAENAGMREALEAAETLYQVGLLNTPNAEIDRVHALRRAALSKASQAEGQTR
ncbi:hypothetical protein [Kaistia sp. UC242_56]|uniref:hypothetical protein n=1 Tax=Kaistia sp. UC242_56 TaxID=3374625 RepID=UPI0037AC0E73